MPMTDDEPQTCTLRSYGIDHNRHDLSMAERLPDEENDEEDIEEDIEEDDEDIDEDEAGEENDEEES